MILEKAGVPAVSIITDAFTAAAREMAELWGIPDFRFVTTAGRGDCQSTPGDPNQPASFITCAQRIPVVSAGVTIRINLFGYMLLETYFARPYQRPQKNWIWGLQIAPGW